MQIYAYVEELMEKAITEGDLQGILLTGLTKDGVTLLQAYVDMVGHYFTFDYAYLKNSREEIRQI